MKNKYNNLKKYIYEYSNKPQHKETINGLFRAVLEPLIQNQKAQGSVFIRLLDKTGKDSSIKRLKFSGVTIYNFSDIQIDSQYQNCTIDDIWENTEFLVVLCDRYSAALIWDYSNSTIQDYSEICILFNSRIITDIAKIIADNSKEDLKQIIKNNVADRRENILLNRAIQTIAALLDEKNGDYLSSEKEKNSFVNSDETIKTAEIVREKAKFISHEIKNYLSVINLYAKIAERRMEDMSASQEIINSANNAIKNINSASENISYLINDLRCLNAPLKTNANLIDIVQNSIDLCRAKLQENKVKINFESLNNIEVYIDKVKLQCAITNIIFNAIDANAKNIIITVKNKSIFIKNNGEKRKNI